MDVTPPPHAVSAGQADQRALVERAVLGDPEAQRTLYDTHVDRVYRLISRLTGREDLARDLTQDTFVRAFAGLSQFRGDSAMSTWLHSIAVSLTLNELRRQARQQAREAPLEDASAHIQAGSLSDPVLRDRISDAVAALPEGCRTVFLMHDAEGYTHEEIAEILGVSPGTSKAQLSRGRAKLRLALAAFSTEWHS